MAIKRLENTIINQIAAGEVVERPASVVKELLDNAIDAGATRIDLSLSDGGKTLIKIVDDGTGMGVDDLQLAIQRHCTSKITNDLQNIATLGFRGEALPSIGSVARLSIASKTNEGEGWEISVEGGRASEIKPAAISNGTIVEVKDLFYATPARLKFLKTERSELSAVIDIFKRIALAHPNIYFRLSDSGNFKLEYPSIKGEAGQARLARIGQVLGDEFKKNSMAIEAKKEGVGLSGYAGLPTFNRGNALHQFFYVNGRNVRDKQLLGAVRGAYMDSMMRFRHAVLVLFLEIEPSKVDVNVHPAKSEVRFYQPSLIRGLIVSTLKRAIVENSQQSSSKGGSEMLRSFTSYQMPVSPSKINVPPAAAQGMQNIQPSAAVDDIADETVLEHALQQPLGAARAQVHKNYIISQTQDGMIIVDQHAAHERLVYEKIKQQWQAEGVVSQIVLIPEIIELSEGEINAISKQFATLKKVGLELEMFGKNSIMVRATPALLGQINAKALLQDLIDDIAEWGGSSLLEERVHHVAATLACYGSVRSGRILKADEMNKLLRDMETTPNSGQCNHGRPTYIELKLKDIERLFGR